MANSSFHLDSIVEIPQNINDSAETVEIKEEIFTFGKNLQAHALIARPPGNTDSRFCVLFLHGAAFTSEIWRQIGSLKLVAAQGLCGVAVDLPGHGKTLATSDVPNFVEEVIAALKLDRPVIVSPSKSGMYALPYIMTPDSETAIKRVRGFVSIAPIATGGYKPADYKRVTVPTMIVTGETDLETGRIGQDTLKNLQALGNAESHVIKEAGHACHVNQPGVFNQLLYNFLVKIESS